MSIQELLEELRRIDELQSMMDAMTPASTSGHTGIGHLLTVSIERARMRLQDRFSSSQIEAATRMRQILSEESA
ncbi:MAG: hypothetical protein KDI75_02800 [Xanthomonadales bacterium]|nr:hypothetical protein [Xanthomonadales bacterium]